MDARRQTLASHGPLGNALPSSSIPVPMSAMKKAPLRTVSSSRMSLAPSRPGAPGPPGGMGMGMGMSQGGQGMMRRSSSQDLAGMAGASGPGRRSTMQSSHAAGGVGMSVSKPDGGVYGRTPQTGARVMPSSTRRSSVYQGGGPRQSLAPGAFAALTSGVKDARPVRNKDFRASCQANITQFLLDARCPIQIKERTLTAPGAQEFQAVFKYLVNQFIDAQFVWGRKFEDDALQLLRDVRYPALQSVGKTALGAPGAEGNWPNMLAMLNWVVELAKAHDRWLDEETTVDPLLRPASQLPLDDPLLVDRLFWDFASKTYNLWFDHGVETFEDAEREMEDIYDKLAQDTVNECEELETEIQKGIVELKQLQAQEPPLKQAESEYMQLMSDKTKFIAFIKSLEQKAEKMRIGNGKARAAISGQEQEVEALRAELSSTEAAVAAQNLSPDEVNRMNHDRETLTRTLDDLRVKISEASQLVYDNEMSVSQKMDRFDTLVQEYTALAHQIGTIQPFSQGLGPDGVDYQIDIDLGVTDPDQIRQNGARMRGSIWPALQMQRERVVQQALELANGQIAAEDKMDRLAQEVEGQKDEVSNKEMRLSLANENAEQAKASAAEQGELRRDNIIKLEGAVNAVSTATQQSVASAKNDLDAKRIAFDELRFKTGQLQEDLRQQISSHIEVIIKAKQQAEEAFRGIRAMAEAMP